MNRTLALVTVLFIFFLTTTASAKSSDWVSDYYLKPTPDRFVDETLKLSKSGALSNTKTNHAIVIFLSQVMAQNPNQITKWINQLNDLPAKDIATIHKAAWFSDTPEAIHYFKKHDLSHYIDRRPPNILDMKLTHPAHLDMLWGYFFATGKQKPIRSITTTFNYYKYKGAIESYKTSKKTKEDQQKAIYEAMFKAALWSIEANSKQHPKVKHSVEKIYLNGNLSENERLWLAYILHRVEPEKYKLKVTK